MFRYTVVAGKWGDDPKPSGYARKLFEVMYSINHEGILFNGGTFSELESLVGRLADVIFWFPDVSNDKEKLVNRLKAEVPTRILVTSKNNLDSRYGFMQLVSRALKTKSNLFVEFANSNNDLRRIRASVNDPLGNCFCVSTNIDNIATALMCRVNELRRFTRIRSCQYKAEVVKPVISPEFFDLTRKYAEVFHDCIHAKDTTRLLGNVSFRCENGFPSFRGEKQIFVSRRNIDKREIGIDGFVPVDLKGDTSFGYNVKYTGDNKPSVDTPIQLLLYRYYYNINFMIHSHTYIKDADFTGSVVPCGAVEEFYEIIKQEPHRHVVIVALNLKGHGSLVMASHYDAFRHINYIPRPSPEDHNYVL